MKQKRKLLYRQGFTDQNRPFRDQDHSDRSVPGPTIGFETISYDRL